MYFRSTQHDHVKTSLSHKIHHIRNIGILKHVEFKDLISSEDYANCSKKKSRTKRYSLTIDIFVALVYKVHISIFVYFDV